MTASGPAASGPAASGPAASGPAASGARAEILGRIRGALANASKAADAPVAREYERERPSEPGDALKLLAERISDYRARVEGVESANVADVVAAICGELGLRQLVVASGVPDDWRPSSVELFDERSVSGPRELDELDGALTGCAVAIAETGTLVLDGGPRSGARATTLVPDHHICIVEADQVVTLVPEAFARLESVVRERRAPITLVSGPSATSDIELSRVEGVHGPRTLVVLLVAG